MSAKKKWFIIGGAAIFIAAAAVFLILHFSGQKSGLPYDISLSSQAGFTAEDFREISKIEGIDSLVGVCEQVNVACIIQSFPETLLTPKLSEGRQIQEPNEVIVDSRYAAQNDLQLGQTLTLTVGGTTSSFIVVGTALPKFDLKKDAKPFFFVDLSVFRSDSYNKIYLCLADDASLGNVQKELRALGTARQFYRSDQLRDELQLKIDEVEQLMHTLLDPEKEALDQAKSQLDAAERSLDISNNTQKLADAKAKLDDSKEKLDLGLQKLDDLKEAVDVSQTELTRYEGELSQCTADYQAALADAGIPEAELDTRYEELSSHSPSEDPAVEQTIKELAALLEKRSAVESSRRKYADAASGLAAKISAYQLGEYMYNTLSAEYAEKESEYEEQNNTFTAAKSSFYAKQSEYQAAMKEYQEKEDSYTQQLSDYTQQRDAIQTADWLISRFSQDSVTPSETAAFK